MSDVLLVSPLIITELEAINGLTVFDAKVGTVLKDDGITRPYAVLYMYPGNLRRLRYVDRSNQARVMFQITCAAGTVAGCRWATDQVIDRLVDHRLNTGSPATAPITMVSEISREVEDRDDLGDIRWFSTPLFSLTMNRS